jgi:hypothetical protein
MSAFVVQLPKDCGDSWMLPTAECKVGAGLDAVEQPETADPKMSANAIGVEAKVDRRDIAHFSTFQNR